jgi:hypothetical protein
MPTPRLCHLECRASLLALAIATAGASVHFAIEIAMSSDDDQPRALEIRCPGHDTGARELAPLAAVSDPSYLEAVELRCRAAGAQRCDLSRAIDAGTATAIATPMFAGGTPDHVFLRYAPSYRRVVWTLTDTRGSTSIDLDAFDGSLVELTE